METSEGGLKIQKQFTWSFVRATDDDIIIISMFEENMTISSKLSHDN